MSEPNEIQIYNNATSLQPRDLGEAMTLAATLAKSTIVPYALRGKPADILIIMMYGMELGLPVNQAMRGINVIKGRPSLSTELRVSKTRERGHRVGVVCVDCGQWADANVHLGINHVGNHRFNADWSKDRCTVKAVRADNGETAEVTWTVEDAIDAGLLWYGQGDLEGKLIARSDKGERLPWETYRKDMLYNRAADRACKQIAPEVGYGLYTREEIEQLPDEPIRVTAEVGNGPLTADELLRDAGTSAPDPDPQWTAPDGAPDEQTQEPHRLGAGQQTAAEVASDHERGALRIGRGRQNMIFALFSDLGFGGDANRDTRLDVIGRIVGRKVSSSNDLTPDEGEQVIAALEERKRAVGGGGDA